jgi:tRNA-Thr(GGU) m(6)t(6)A37 methyltransferase TsaA
MKADLPPDFSVQAIGIIRSPFITRAGMPIQASRSDAVGEVLVHPEYEAGPKDLDGFSHIILVYWFHQAKEFSLMVQPFLDKQSRGLFATQYPARPNRIGLSVVELTAVEGCTLHVRGVDVLDATPLLDIKPFVPAFDHREGARVGWLAGRA